MEAFSRSAMLVGEEGIHCLAHKKVAVFGIGGVGGHVCEALARAGVGSLALFDDDVVGISNLNRQIVALHSTIGQAKVEVMAARIRNINPACKVTTHRVFYTPDNADEYPLNVYDYVVDAIDTVSAKLELIVRAKAAGVPVISAMGAGNKLHPECFELADIEKTTDCPLARVMRRELKKRHIKDVLVVYSREPARTPQPPQAAEEPEPAGQLPSGRPGTPKKIVPGSMSFVPGASGLIIAGAVVRGLLGID